MTTRKLFKTIWLDAIALVVVTILFIVPFVFIVLMASKTSQEASLFQFTWPSQFQLFDNIRDVLTYSDNRMILAMWNSIILTVGSVTLTVLLAALAAYIMQQRQGRITSIASAVMLAGLIIPPAVVPTIFLLQQLGIYKTLIGLIFIEVAFGLPFAVLIFRAFVGSIPRELDEAAVIDGASALRVFFQVILPLLRSAMVTIIVVQSVAVYNDFAGPLYFLPGSQNVTVQLTLFSFISQFNSQYNLLFANAVVITIPALIMFLFFQKQIVAGMTAGSVKG
ncbi:MAG TPA: carbohydrate ABC transporter permease [Chloroflexia bacterium]|nr:carbohydrate ABC transporter permease [Chloroflexia bacterium]